MRASSLFSLLAIAATFLGAPASASAWCRMTTSMTPLTAAMPCATDGIPLEWQRRCTSYSLNATGSSTLSMEELRGIFSTAFEQWTSITCDGASAGIQVRQMTELNTCDHAEYQVAGSNIQTIAFTHDWNPTYDPNAYAVTTVWHNVQTGEILDVDMEINENRGPYAMCPDIGCTDGRVDLLNVVTHETGHYFGLGHTIIPTATMYRASPAGETIKRSLEGDDVAGFCEIYPPDSLPAECDDEPRGGLPADLACGVEDPRGCCTVAPGANGSARGAAFLMLALALVVASRRKSF